MSEADLDKISGKLMAEDLDSDDDFFEERKAQLGIDVSIAQRG
jgi:hypothetical protein